MSSLVELFRSVPDHRSRNVYPLEALLSLCVVGFMCGRTGLLGIERLAEDLPPKALDRLGFKRCLRPKHNRMGEIFRDMDVAALEKALAQAANRIQFQQGFHHVAMDGKRLCGSVSEENPKGVHLVALFSQALSGVLGQMPIEKGNEITAAIALLSEVDLEGCVVTGDAIFCQKEVCRLIRERGGHYVIALKDNHKLVKRAVENAFSLRRPKTAEAG